MMSCWSQRPRDRPMFRDLVGMFTRQLERESGSLDFLCWKENPHVPDPPPPTARPVIIQGEQDETEF